MFHFGNCNRGYSSFVTSVVGLTEPHEIWSYQFPETVYSSPVVGDLDNDSRMEILIDASPSSPVASGGMLYCFNESGQIQWTFQGDPGTASAWTTPSIGDIDQNGFAEVLYWSNSPKSEIQYDQELFCFEPNGSLRWGYAPSYGGLGSTDHGVPTLGDITGGGRLEILVQHTHHMKLYCVKANGVLRWVYDYSWMNGDEFDSRNLHVAPAIADLNNDSFGETVVSMAWRNSSINQGAIFCVDVDGNLLWSRQDLVPWVPETTTVGSSPVIDDVDGDGFLEVLVGGKDGVWCLNKTGDTVWSYAGVEVYGTVAIADIDDDGWKELIFGGEDGYVYCLNHTGNLEWSFLTGGAVESSVAIADIERPIGGEPEQLEIIVGSHDGKLYCLNSTGSALWTYDCGASVISSPAIVDLKYSGNGNPEIIVVAGNKLQVFRLTEAHDVAVTDVSPHKDYVGQGYMLPINVTVRNKGSFLETFNVSLYSNDVELYTQPIVDLSAGTSEVVTFEWNTTEAPDSGPLFEMKATVEKVPNEYHVADNFLIDGVVMLDFPQHDVAVTGITLYEEWVVEGDSLEVDITYENQGNMKESFSLDVYANETQIYSLTVVEMDSDTTIRTSFYWNTTGYAAGNYIITANATMVMGEIDTSDNTYSTGLFPLYTRACIYVNPQTVWVQPNQSFTINVCISDAVDLWIWQINLYFDPAVLTWVSGGSLQGDYVLGSDFIWPPFWGNSTLMQITFKGNTENITYLNFSRTGTVIFDSESQTMPFCIVDGLVKVAQHEIATTQVIVGKSVVGQGYSVMINATIENKGFVSEVFNVTLYTNSTIIDQGMNVTLLPEESVTLPFVWNTTGFLKGNYTIAVVADPVLGEVDIGDNTLSGGTIFVSVPGDFDGDKDVDIFDITFMTIRYGVIKPGPLYNPICDFDDDGDIDIFDVIPAASNYGESW